MTKVEAIVALLKEKGGAADWDYIYENIEHYYPKAKVSDNWKAGLRGVLFRELYQNQYFKRVDIGVYALRDYEDIETLEGVKKIIKDKQKVLELAKAFTATVPSHKIVEGKRKVRIEDRLQKERVADIEEYSCQICGWSAEWEDSEGNLRFIIEIDHIFPKELGGGEELSNLWALCPNCHKKKTFGIIVVDQINKQILENGIKVELHHNNHLWM